MKFCKASQHIWSGKGFKTFAWESSIFKFLIVRNQPQVIRSADLQYQRISFWAWDSKNKLSYKVKAFNLE